MPKYRLLTQEELNELEKEFVDFLIINGIDAKEWQRIQDEQSEDLERFVELFSDVVFEKIMRQTRHLVYTAQDQLYAFNYGPDKASLIIAVSEGLPFPETENEDELLAFLVSNASSIHINYQEKDYKGNREEEIYKMIQSSCKIIGEKVYAHLIDIYGKKN